MARSGRGNIVESLIQATIGIQLPKDAVLSKARYCSSGLAGGAKIDNPTAGTDTGKQSRRTT